MIVGNLKQIFALYCFVPKFVTMPFFKNPFTFQTLDVTSDQTALLRPTNILSLIMKRSPPLTIYVCSLNEIET